MQFSTEITLEDHLEFVDELDRASDLTGEAKQAADALGKTGRGQLLALLVFAGALGAFLYRRGLDDLLHHPVLLPLVVIGLICVPIAIAWQLATRRLRRTLVDTEADKLDLRSLREGLNIGHTQFDLQPERLCVTLDLVRSCFAWESFQSLRKVANAYHLMFDERHVVIVPDRAFGNETARRDFEDFVTAHIGQGK